MINTSTIIAMVIALLTYLLQFQSSLMYFANKYNVKKQDVIDLLESSSPIFQDLFSKSKNYSFVEDFYTDPKRYRMIYVRILFAFFMMLVPMRVVYDMRTKDFLVSEQIILSLYLFIHAILFYYSWRFGHSLKSKAQK